jgi:hypothetical protein
MSPTRRTLLAGAGLLGTGLLAGCVAAGTGSPDGTPSPDPTDSPTPTPTATPGPSDGPLPEGDGGDDGDGDAGGTRPRGTGGPGLSLVGTDPTPDLPVEPGVRVLEPVATADHPPALRVTLTNTSGAPVTVGEGRAVRFQFVVDDARILQLLPTEGEYPVTGGNCWRLSEAVATTMEYRTEELAAGETITADVELYALSDYDGCLPVGEFRFVTRLGAGDSMESMAQADWGFTVLLE